MVDRAFRMNIQKGNHKKQPEHAGLVIKDVQ